MLQAWRIIKDQIPEAILEVYYGFTPTIEARLEAKLGDKYTSWRDTINRLLLQDGIRYIGPGILQKNILFHL